MRACYLFLFLCLPLHGATYTHPTSRFQFQYDASRWEIVRSVKLGRTLVTVQRKSTVDQYRARFTVVEDKLRNGEEVDLLLSYQKHALDFLKNQRFRILSTKLKKLPGLTNAVYETIASQRDFGLTFQQVVLTTQKKAYLLTGATRSDEFNSQKSDLAQFFETFSFLEKEPKKLR